MKFTCPSQILSEACMNVQRATSTKSTNLPTIEGILIKAENYKFVESLVIYILNYIIYKIFVF